MSTRMVGIGWLVMVLALGQLASGQEDQPAPRPENHMRGIEMQFKQMDLEQRRAELNFDNTMRDIQVEQKQLELERNRQMPNQPGQNMCPGKAKWRGHHFRMMHCAAFMFVCFIVHILLAVWVYGDIRRRNAGSGIWIVITLLTGLLGVLVYAIVRLGDKPAA